MPRHLPVRMRHPEFQRDDGRAAAGADSSCVERELDLPSEFENQFTAYWTS